MTPPSARSLGRDLPSEGLSRFAWLTAAVATALIGVGGLVTSRGAGLSVPDWPNSYGYSMYTFPISHWMGGILYEHSHRLLGVLVGLLTTILAVWMWARETRGRQRWIGVGLMVGVAGLLGRMGEWQRPIFIGLASVAPLVIAWGLVRFVNRRTELRWLGVAAFAAVILQGTLGGLRVVWLADELGMVHGILAQGFLVLICFIALISAAHWRTHRVNPAGTRELFPAWLLAIGLVVLQLSLGAAMRHRHAGLAVPDFPLAYGRVWPATDATAIARYNQTRVEATAQKPIQAADVLLHMAHRFNGILLAAAGLWLAVRTWRRVGSSTPLGRLAIAWSALLTAQVALGAATVWTAKSADIATLHMLTGAVTLVVVCFAAAYSAREAPVLKTVREVSRGTTGTRRVTASVAG